MKVAPKMGYWHDEQLIRSRTSNPDFYVDKFDGSKKAEMRPPVPALPGDEEDKQVRFTIP
jgi:hypothetical protein